MVNTYSESISYFNKSYTLAKACTGSPYRASFGKLYERVQPFCSEIGLKRLSNITGLDRIGIPVVNAIRPNATGLIVAHGKGLTLNGAKASALMESIERYYGFNAELSHFELPYEALCSRFNTVPVDRLALRKESAFNPQLPEKWVLGWDVIKRQEVAVPLHLVLMGRSPYDLDSFFQSSNGLAAGLEFMEAFSQALFEVVERDALTCQHLYMRSQNIFFPPYRVRLESIIATDVKFLLSQIEKAGIIPVLFDCSVDTEIPTYECFLIDIEDQKMVVGRGMGSSLKVETAMLRSITEAVQARAVYYSGCRETFFTSEMVAPGIHDSARTLEYLKKGCDQEWSWVDATTRVSVQTATFEEDINRSLEKLMNIGIEQVIVVNLAPETASFTALRVIVPGLEGIDELLYYAPGSRARKYMEGLKP